MTEDDINEITVIKRRLESKFDIRHLGRLKYFLGMKSPRSKEEIFLNQHKYILDLLSEIWMIGVRQ